MKNPLLPNNEMDVSCVLQRSRDQPDVVAIVGHVTRAETDEGRPTGPEVAPVPGLRNQVKVESH